MTESLANICSSKAIAIIRVKDTHSIARIVDCLVDGGIKALEITSNTPNYLLAIKDIRKRYPNISIGAGTITNTFLASEAIDAGAQFLVTPNTSRPVIAMANTRGIPIVVGAFTPSEVYNAYEWGADLVKLFPSNVLGLDYVKSLVSGPFNQIPILSVGAVDEKNAADWLEVGCKGVGFAGNLTQPILSENDYTIRKARIKSLLNSIN